METDREPLTRGDQFTIGDFALAFFFGIAVSVIGAVAGQPFGTVAAVLAALIGQQVGHILAIVYLVKVKGRAASALGFDVQPRDARYILLGLGLQIALTVALEPLIRRLVPDGNPQALGPILGDVTGVPAQLLFVLAIALLAPVSEELMFRGMLTYTLAERRGNRFGLLVGTAVFALLHATSLSGEDAEAVLKSAVVTLPALFSVGLVLGLLALRHKRLGPAIFTHIGFNVLAVVVLFAE